MPRTDDTPRGRARPKTRTKTRTKTVTKTRPGVRPSAVVISHPEREMVPGTGFSKRDLAAYYEAMAPQLLAYAGGRPLAMLRCPGGSGAPCFLTKHPTFATPELRQVTVRETRGQTAYVCVEDPAGLQRLAQMNVLEIHPMNTLAEDEHHPDRFIIDLDPGPEVAWDAVVHASARVAALLREAGLVPFFKTTGGKGVHVVVPLTRAATVEETLAFTRALCETLAKDDPRRLTTGLAKKGRERQVLLDYLRNGRGATAVAAFSPRAREGAPVSVPVFEEELMELDPAKGPAFTPARVLARLEKQRRDPWKAYAASTRPLPGEAGVREETREAARPAAPSPKKRVTA